jgi:hypothetical protein
MLDPIDQVRMLYEAPVPPIYFRPPPGKIKLFNRDFNGSRHRVTADQEGSSAAESLTWRRLLRTQ